jgi:hypothetical protein
MVMNRESLTKADACDYAESRVSFKISQILLHIPPLSAAFVARDS